jgi:predicted nucleic acid-binding protein
MILVLDASVAVKWAMPAANEPLMAQARQLLSRYERGELEFIVPDIFWAELTNVLWSGARRARWSRADAELAITDMLVRNFVTIASASLLPEAVKISFENDRSVYDSLYAALAIQARTDLVTADERLANALAVRFPVKWLGAL